MVMFHALYLRLQLRVFVLTPSFTGDLGVYKSCPLYRFLFVYSPIDTQDRFLTYFNVYITFITFLSFSAFLVLNVV